MAGWWTSQNIYNNEQLSYLSSMGVINGVPNNYYSNIMDH